MRALKSLFFVFGLLLSAGINAQENVVIETGTFETCGGAFLDSGGQGGPGYSNGEYFVCTICPETEGDVITVDFITFSLDQSGPQNSWDSMSIYDGDSTNEGFLGVYTGNDLQGLFVTATPLNTSGCLTFVFESNNVGTGNFGGTITCDTPCDRPTAEGTYDAPENKRICVGDVINFDGSASFAAPGFEIVEWLWDFADGTTDDSGPITSHSWDEPGEYIVELFLVDDNGCASTNRISLQVLVATYPEWDPFPVDANLCLGEQICFEAFPDDYEVTWSGPDLNYTNGDNVALSDNVGECFPSEIEVTGFAPGQTLDNINDLLSIDVSVEHSFLFDLVVSIECPSGESVVLHQQMQQPDGPNVGSNGTDLGIANQEPWDYSWTNNAPNGTWSQVATGGGNNSLPAGDYSSLEPLENLVGCDLNGTWTISFCDLWGGDDGELYSWGLNFNPAIIPDVTEFTPDIGAGADSSFWSFDPAGLNVLSQSDDGNEVCVLPEIEGVFPFTYTVINNHGCQHEETVNITVEQAGQADAGPDLTMCGPGTMLQGGLDGQPAPSCSNDGGNYTYCYTNNENTVFTYCPDNPGDAITFIDIAFNAGTVEGFFDELNVYDGDNTGAPLLGSYDGNLAGLSWIATNPTGCLTMQFTSDGSVACQNGSQTEWNYDVGCTLGAPAYEYEWSPAEFLSDPNSPSPEVLSINGETVFTLATWPSGQPDCTSYDEVTVFPAFDFDVEHFPPSCNGNDGVINIMLDGNSGEGPWTITVTEDGAQLDSFETNGGDFVYDGLTPGAFVVSIADTGGCEYVIDIDMPEPQPMEFDLSPDVTICLTGSTSLEASSDMDFNGTWEYTWDQGLGVSNSVTVSPMETTTYTVFATDQAGCTSEPQSVTVSLYDPLSVAITGPDVICGGSVAELEVSDADGGFGAYSYEWFFNGLSIGNGDAVSNEQQITGEYCAVITDACETPSETSCIEVVVETPLAVAFEADTTQGCIPQALEFTILNEPEAYEEAVWDFGNGTVSTELDPIAIYPDPGLYDVSLQLTSPLGCIYDVNYPAYISIFTNPVAGFQASPQPTTMPETEISFFDQSSSNVVLWDWIFDTGSLLGMSQEQNPVFEFPIDVGGVYPVRLTVTDVNGCTDQITRDIVVNDLLNIYVPNAFSPNNDGVNELFKVEGTDIDPSRFSLMVFNRWGEKVFETTDINEGWNGDFQGGDYYIQNEIYTWRLVVHALSTAERIELSGTVAVMR